MTTMPLIYEQTTQERINSFSLNEKTTIGEMYARLLFLHHLYLDAQDWINFQGESYEKARLQRLLNKLWKNYEEQLEMYNKSLEKLRKNGR